MLVFYIILVIPYLTYFCSLPCQIKWFNPTLLYAILKKSCSFFHPKISNFLTVPAFAVPYHFAWRIPQIFYFRLAAMIHNIIYCIILFSLIEKYFSPSSQISFSSFGHSTMNLLIPVLYKKYQYLNKWYYIYIF